MLISNSPAEQQNEFRELFTTHFVRELNTLDPEPETPPNEPSSSPGHRIDIETIRRVSRQMRELNRQAGIPDYRPERRTIQPPITNYLRPLSSASPPRPIPPSNSSSIELTQAGQERANEFREHSIQRRSTHRTLPSLSDLDNHSLLEALKRWGENRKRKHQDSLSEPHSHRSSFRASQTSGDLNSSSHPTTAELAEAAARESNARRCLPAFYTPDDEQLKVRTMVIPIDTNPMERRKIIVACSKDGSLRWKDSDQKTVYERSKDGLVGEEIGEIEFDYLCLPKKSLRKSSSSPLHSNRSNPNTNSSSSSSPTRESSNHRAHPSSAPETDTGRAFREALENINEARAHQPRTLRAHYDLQRWHLERPGYHRYADPSLLARRGRYPAGSELAAHIRPRSDNRAQEPAAAAAAATTGPARLSRSSTSSVVSRLTRRPIRWFERPSITDLPSIMDYAGTRPSTNPELNPLPPISSYASSFSSIRPFSTATNSASASASAAMNDLNTARDALNDNVEALYQELYNPNHPLDQFLFSSTIQRSRP
ncbi:hypothetical protein PtA15_4A14 [Puccinia triticina]|uniref:Uncharacterized protein n=1 Tax=Puccinia triticina TaxID=208348 RepID=A0ABY7CEC5_9BASI|nr:uncharacterized protein PtA15_4A14 [Puccinia triticina]WAQ83566.1 hypothetical protein PtA15_4A14 [Puccinia triticina]WAR54398.1 hypothetical protein PtB15_4B15 [Puccinia triticina]